MNVRVLVCGLADVKPEMEIHITTCFSISLFKSSLHIIFPSVLPYPLYVSVNGRYSPIFFQSKVISWQLYSHAVSLRLLHPGCFSHCYYVELTCHYLNCYLHIDLWVKSVDLWRKTPKLWFDPLSAFWIMVMTEMSCCKDHSRVSTVSFIKQHGK